MKQLIACCIVAMTAFTLVAAPTTGSTGLVGQSPKPACQKSQAKLFDVTSDWGPFPGPCPGPEELGCSLTSWYPDLMCLFSTDDCFASQMLCEQVHGTGSCISLLYPSHE